MTVSVLGSMTWTVPACWLGTYTRVRAARAGPVTAPAPVAAYGRPTLGWVDLVVPGAGAVAGPLPAVSAVVAGLAEPDSFPAQDARARRPATSTTSMASSWTRRVWVTRRRSAAGSRLRPRALGRPGP